jgi:uncharacterized membrane protein YfcA
MTVAGPDAATVIEIAAFLAAAGALTGVLAGLFGVGGGTITVPILFHVFSLLGAGEDVAMPLAVGTSLAIIVPTSIRSARGHYERGAVDMMLVRNWAAPVVTGVIAGAVIARFASAGVFQAVFVVVASSNAIKLLFGGEKWKVADAMPAGPLSLFYGGLVGLASTLMGIGGGTIANLIFTLHSKPIHNAVATSAALGVLISIPATAGYMLAGWGQTGLPADALGYVSLLAFALIVPTTLLTTGLGVRIAHRLSKRQLEVAFGLYLVAVSLHFILRLAGGL